MGALSPTELLDEIREGLAASAWSLAVRTVRGGGVAVFSSENDVWQLDVSMGRRLPYRVELNLDDEDWQCVCVSREDACVHVAAAALFLSRLSKADIPLPTGLRADGPHLRHRFEATPKGWQLAMDLIDDDGCATPVGRMKGLTVPLTAGDRALLGFPGWRLVGERRLLNGVPAHRLQHLLEALALCPDVWVKGQPVKVVSEPLIPVIRVEDHPRGLLVVLGPSGTHHATLEGIPELVVVGNPPTLRPMGVPALPHEQADDYRRGRIITGDRMAYFLSDVVPRLRARIPVEMRAENAPKAVHLRPYALLRLTEAVDGVDAMATVTYGKPPQAVVVGDRVHPVGGSKMVPHRVRRDESRLNAMIEKVVGISAGRRRRISGFDASDFLSRVVAKFDGEIEGKHLIERMKVREAALTPVIASADGGVQLSFALEGATGDGDGEAASAQEVLDAWREGRPLVRLLDGGFARLPSGWMDEYGPLVEAIIEARGEEAEVYRQVVQAQLVEAVDSGPDIAALKRAARSRLNVPEVVKPDRLKATLRPYQSEGLSWLAHLSNQGLGGILADDMGLGKTVQTLALMVHEGTVEAPTLVVAPTSVLYNWQSEASRFAPSLPLRRYHGAKRSLKWLRPGEVVITSYGLLRRDLEVLGGVAWHRVILDEAQAIKNPASKVSKAARLLNAKHRLALTGTPVENHIVELWSILDFVNPGVLGGRRAFTERYGDLEGAGRQEAVRRLRVRVKPFILRRLKQDVAKDLPPKTEVVLRCPLSTDERKLYNALQVSSRAEVKKLTGGSSRGGLQILELLLRLRQACCHPGLVPGSGELGAKHSNKVRLLVKHLEVVLDEGHKALVFSQWTSLLDKVEPALKEKGIEWTRLDGSTRDRGAVVDNFQSPEGPGVFLISLKAGGTGLNLTAADYVYLLDPWWNPAVEAQAIDRTYRIGQTRPVVATRLVAADTIEERVLDLQERKRAVTEAALGGEAQWLSSLSETELDSLLGA